jgi:hypothetical protein
MCADAIDQVAFRDYNRGLQFALRKLQSRLAIRASRVEKGREHQTDEQCG